MANLQDKRVKYVSTGRPWLSNREGKVVSMNLQKTSALVEFPANDLYNKNSEWIGVGALEVLGESLSEARQKVQTEKVKLEKQISELRSKVAKLNHADKALKDLGL